MSNIRSIVAGMAIGLTLCAGLAIPVQTAAAQATKAVRRRVDPRRATLEKLSKEITVEFSEQPLGEVFAFIAEITGAQIDVGYLDDRHDSGFDAEMPITMSVRGQSGLDLIVRIIRLVNGSDDLLSPMTWQLSEDGLFEVGAKDRLGRNTRIEIYDIRDLIFVVPHFTDAPEISISQSGGSGRGGGSPFGGGGGGSGNDQRVSSKERVEELIEMIKNTVEMDEWVDLGGDSSSIASFQDNTLIVTAPDFVHRQINGYRFWPSRLQRARVVKGRREMEIRPKKVKRSRP